MGILRADVVSHSQLQPTGSVAFDGTTDYLTIPASSAWLSGLANSTVKKSFTVEWWQYWNAVSGYVDLLDVNYTNGLLLEANNGKYTVYAGGGSAGVEATAAVTGQWYHYALVFYSGAPLAPGSTVLYRDGELSASSNVAGNIQIGNSSTVLSIGAKQSNGAYCLNGYISNFRWCDRVVYNAPFTPPKFELTAIAGTQLLCCQSSSSATEAAVIPGGLSITANGNAAASAFAPDIKKDITDTGVVFADNTKFDTLSYMVPPGGTTAQSNRGRGVFAQGYSPGDGASATLNYFEISSGGITQNFGNLTQATYTMTAGSSSTRGVLAGGYLAAASPIYDINTIEYVTIATTSNATNFGDRTVIGRSPTAVSSETRVCMAGGGSTYTNIIDFITTSTTGDATNFGDLGDPRTGFSNSMQSTTRGIFAGGYQAPSPFPAVNTLEYITMASAGDATNFGDMTSVGTNSYGGSMSSNTRGVTALGNAPGATNIINYVTIATTGDAADFGDMTTTRKLSSSCSSHIRGVIIGGETPTYVNTIEYITIATLGNSIDFGDVGGGLSASSRGAACSDSHGGIS